MVEILSHFIGGEEIPGSAQLESINPSDTREVIAKYPKGNSADVDAAVRAARGAFPDWSRKSPEVRADLLDKVGNAILEQRQALGMLLAREEGKTLAEATGEVVRAARIFRYFGGEALRQYGRHLDSTRPNIEVFTTREAVGVFGIIAPWNFPIAIPAWKTAPALAFGNTVVLKPAGPTPAIAYALAKIIHEAGLPDGVFNLVLGGSDVGNAIVNHLDVDGISFTGSQTVGAKVGMGAMARQARVQMEMGGKNPLLILNDADFERAVQVALDGGYFATGQRCTASSRILVEKDIYEKFIDALARRVAALKVGNAIAADTQMGPVVTEDQLRQDLSYVEIAVKEGGKLVFGGEALTLDSPGYYMSSALLVDTRANMRINCEEVFGPVVSVMPVSSYEDGLAIANAGNFGLSAGICTSSLKYAQHFQRSIRAGMVMVNLPTAGVDYHVPFGGSRSSSYGPREQGFAAIEFYTQTKIAYCST